MTAEEKKRFQSSLWRLFTEVLIRQFKGQLIREIDEETEKAEKSGITNYQEWIKWKLEEKEESDGSKTDLRRTQY